MRRRDFIAGLGSAVASPLAARAQRGERMRRIGVLSPYAENDQETKYGLSVFKQGLAELGWTDGGNLRMDVRWAAGNVDRVRVYAKELVDLQPDVILADGTPQTAALQRETKTIPIVFVVVADPVGSGFVAGLPRPGGNITGFIPIAGSPALPWSTTPTLTASWCSSRLVGWAWRASCPSACRSRTSRADRATGSRSRTRTAPPWCGIGKTGGAALCRGNQALSLC